MKIKMNIQSKNEIFMFISGFNLAFIFPFTFSMLVGLGVFGEVELFRLKDYGDEYHSILLSFDFFVLSYLFQLNGVILLIFIWLRNNKIKLIFYIALGALFLPFIILLISLVVQMRFMSDFVTPFTYYSAFVLGIISYLEDHNDNAPQKSGLVTLSQN